jgi:hypothetical protein
MLVASLILCHACFGDTSGPGAGPSEDLGVPVTPALATAEFSPLAWSPDGEEIFFLGPGPRPDLKAVHVSDGLIRTVVADSQPSFFSITPDGQWIYRMISAASSASVSAILQRIPSQGGVPETIAENVARMPTSVWSFPPISAGARQLAFAARGERGDPNDVRISTRDTLYLYEFASGAKTAIGFGNPLAFSPDGSQLAYDERPCNEGGEWNNPCDTYVLDLRTGTRQHIPWDKGDIGKQAWWDESGLKSLAVTHHFDSPTSPLQWVLRNLSTGSVIIVHALTLGKEIPSTGSLERARDGARVAGWIDYFAQGFEGLRVIDVQTLRGQVVVVNRTGRTSSIAFSWDSRRVAYLISARIFVHDLPDRF